MEQTSQAPPAPTVMDRIIAEALERAQTQAIDSVFARFGSDSEVMRLLREHVVAHLRSPEGRAKVVALADKAIERLMAPGRL
jgi:hypothetical protein